MAVSPILKYVCSGFGGPGKTRAPERHHERWIQTIKRCLVAPGVLNSHLTGYSLLVEMGLLGPSSSRKTAAACYRNRHRKPAGIFSLLVRSVVRPSHRRGTAVSSCSGDRCFAICWCLTMSLWLAVLRRERPNAGGDPKNESDKIAGTCSSRVWRMLSGAAPATETSVAACAGWI